MKSTEEIFEILKSRFSDAVTNLVTEQPVESYFSVAPGEINNVCLFLKDTEELLFDNLMNLSGVDDNNGEKKSAEDGTFTITGANFKRILSSGINFSEAQGCAQSFCSERKSLS